MQATLKFNLPEDNDDFQMSLRGPKYHMAFEDIFNAIRSKLKHETLKKGEAEMWEKFRELVHQSLTDYDIEEIF